MTRHLSGCRALALLGAAVLIESGAGPVLAQTTYSLPRQQPARAAPPPELHFGKPAVKPVAAAQPKVAAPPKVATQPKVAAPPKVEAQPRMAAQTRPSQPPQTTAETGSVFDDHIRQGKIVTCARTFGALGRRISANSAYTAQSEWDSRASNDHSIQALVALTPPPNAPTHQPDAGIVFAAPVGSSCEGHLMRVTPVSENCADIAAKLAKSQGQNSMLGDLSVSAMPNGSQVMLIPFEKSCIAVTVLRGTG
ncbi:MAG: hypothetical protein FWD68_18580 [Alphaproteobacteria bacterium]|nr:hypothetical protein [Alphaproteobacteria bacterium]